MSRPSEPVIGSYVYHGGKCWNVSTIFRETIVWEYDLETKARGEMVHQDDGFDNHFEICRRIYREGAFWDKEEA